MHVRVYVYIHSGAPNNINCLFSPSPVPRNNSLACIELLIYLGMHPNPRFPVNKVPMIKSTIVRAHTNTLQI